MKNKQKFLAVLLGVTGIAQAEVNITQDQAMKGNVTPGDTPGFPITISQPGSYRLNTNLVVVDQNVSGIEILADNVNIDMNGHAIIGPQECEGRVRVDCHVYGETVGITSRSASVNYQYSKVLNGSVMGFHDGVLLGQSSHIEGMLAARNLGTGLAASTFSMIKNSRSNLNGGTGIGAGSWSSIIGNVADGNGHTGISAGFGNTVAENTAGNNGSDGIRTTFRGNVMNNTTISNQFNGIYVGPFTRVVGNTATDNKVGYRLATGSTFGDNFASRNSDDDVKNFGASQLSTNICGSRSC